MITLVTGFGQSREDWGLEFEEERWLNLRKDKVTGTTAHYLLDGLSVDEVLQKKANATPFSGNYWTYRGKLLEREARLLYQDLNGVQVQEVAAILNSKYPRALSSPDGLVGKDGGLEIKSFGLEHHLALFNKIDSEIVAQIQFNLFLSERKWWDFFAYNPETPSLEQAYLQRRFCPDTNLFKIFQQVLAPQNMA